MEKIINIEGMSCGGCSSRLERVLNAIEGVNAKVSHEDGNAVVQIENTITDDVLKNAVENAGFTVININ